MNAPGSFATAGEEFRPVVVTGAPTAEEEAAAIAVIAGLLGASDTAPAQPLLAGPGGADGAWQRSQRAVRAQLERGAGRWRSFSG